MSERIKNTNNVDEFETLDLPDAVVETAEWKDDIAVDDDKKENMPEKIGAEEGIKIGYELHENEGYHPDDASEVTSGDLANKMESFLEQREIDRQRGKITLSVKNGGKIPM